MLEMLVGLNVSDENNYSLYRKGMTPILTSVGGGFGYDFKVSDVLINKSGNEMNRVFTIYFPTKEVMKSFFSNPDYLKIKAKFFEGSVLETTIISTYERNE
ncbi:MAG: hypothetical protein ACJAT2_000207 [Bacteriovoracaceae bacterium]|jgi:uncharacterized protein (DUF1330 family)